MHFLKNTGKKAKAILGKCYDLERKKNNSKKLQHFPSTIQRTILIYSNIYNTGDLHIVYFFMHDIL